MMKMRRKMEAKRAARDMKMKMRRMKMRMRTKMMRKMMRMKTRKVKARTKTRKSNPNLEPTAQSKRSIPSHLSEILVLKMLKRDKPSESKRLSLNPSSPSVSLSRKPSLLPTLSPPPFPKTLKTNLLPKKLPSLRVSANSMNVFSL